MNSSIVVTADFESDGSLLRSTIHTLPKFDHMFAAHRTKLNFSCKRSSCSLRCLGGGGRRDEPFNIRHDSASFDLNATQSPSPTTCDSVLRMYSMH